MAVNKRYEQRLTMDIHDHLKKFGPTTARSLTEAMNPRYRNSLTVRNMVVLLRKEEAEDRIVKVSEDDRIILWGTKMK